MHGVRVREFCQMRLEHAIQMATVSGVTPVVHSFDGYSLVYASCGMLPSNKLVVLKLLKGSEPRSADTHALCQSLELP